MKMAVQLSHMDEKLENSSKYVKLLFFHTKCWIFKYFYFPYQTFFQN
jgi:hypothetical protein